jgi:hypothetical protein
VPTCLTFSTGVKLNNKYKLNLDRLDHSSLRTSRDSFHWVSSDGFLLGEDLALGLAPLGPTPPALRLFFRLPETFRILGIHRDSP